MKDKFWLLSTGALVRIKSTLAVIEMCNDLEIGWHKYHAQNAAFVEITEGRATLLSLDAVLEYGWSHEMRIKILQTVI